MAGNDWDIDGVGIALGGQVVSTKPGVMSVRIQHKELGTRLKLEMAPAHRGIRLYCDRNGGDDVTVLSRTDLFGITNVMVDEANGEVRFQTGEPRPTELVVTEDATFQMAVGRQGQEVPPPTATDTAPPLPPVADDGLIHLVGKLARPHYSDRTGKPFFTAGLAEYPDQGVVPIWHNLKAFGGVARQAAELERGQIVRLTGKSQEDRYRNRKGEDIARPVILLMHIEATG